MNHQTRSAQRVAPRLSPDTTLPGSHVYRTDGWVTRALRETRNGHRGRLVWLTGLSGAGKSTLAVHLEQELFRIGRQVYLLDGDNIRHGLCSDLGFSSGDRIENIRRVGEVGKLMVDAGLICIAAFISPYRSDRDRIRSGLAAGDFIEVFVDAPVAVCESRDPKGLYARARRSEIAHFTGISAPYEPPLKPEIHLQTHLMPVPQCVQRILDAIQRAAPPAP